MLFRSMFVGWSFAFDVHYPKSRDSVPIWCVICFRFMCLLSTNSNWTWMREVRLFERLAQKFWYDIFVSYNSNRVVAREPQHRHDGSDRLTQTKKYRNKLTQRIWLAFGWRSGPRFDSARLSRNRFFLFRRYILRSARAHDGNVCASASIYSLKCHFPQFAKHIMLNAHSFCSLAERGVRTSHDGLTLFRTTVWFRRWFKMRAAKKNCLPNWRREKATPCDATSSLHSFWRTHFKCACVRTPDVCGTNFSWITVRHQHCHPSLSRIRFSIRRGCIRRC